MLQKREMYSRACVEYSWNLLGFFEKSDRHEVYQSILNIWAENDPLVQRVLQGETTFEEMVRPLIDENNNLCLFGRRACYSKLFVIVAEKYREQFANIVSFRSVHQGSFVDLTAVVNRAQWLRKELKRLVSFLPILSLFVWLICCWLTGGIADSIKITLEIILACILIYSVVRAKQYTVYLRQRRDFAEKTLADVRFLDAVAQTIRNKE
ncbi:TPA: hypothetical protein DEP58_05360 [Patescibacteria group bacterium]|nr:MAG: hypothetical protein UU98_C0003G0042 [Parcubacteria group bacterium GW2011_GWD2_42_14]HCC05695.1 hypothetical protein [Patescibacteria group bacterium]